MADSHGPHNNSAGPYVVAHTEAHFTEYWPTGIVGAPRPIGEKLWEGAVDVHLENVGDGPALYVQASLNLEGTAYLRPPQYTPDMITALRPGVTSELIRFVPPPETLTTPWEDDHRDGEVVVT